MAATNRKIGRNGYVSFQGTEVSPDYRNFNVELTMETVDKTAGAEGSKSYIASLMDGTATLEYAYVGGTTDVAYVNKLKRGAEGTLLWGPEGTAANKPKGGAYAIVTGVSKPHVYNDIITRTITFQFSGDLLFDDEEDVWS